MELAFASCKSWMGLTLVSSLLLAVFSWAKCKSYWENFSSAHVLGQIFVQIQDILKCQKHLCEFLLIWALQFQTTLLGESAVRYKIAARPTSILQATQQASENCSINLYVKGRKKNQIKQLKLMQFSPWWRLALMDCQRHTLVWNCACWTWAMLTTQPAVTQMLPEKQFQTALGGKKKKKSMI